MRLIPDEVWGPLCIYAEARGETFEGQVAVGNVIRNRMRMGYFSDGSVASTVLWPYQFSWMNTEDKQRRQVLQVDLNDPRLTSALRAWEESRLHRQVPDGTVLYHGDYMDPFPRWAKSEKTEEVAHIGRHIFYREV